MVRRDARAAEVAPLHRRVGRLASGRLRPHQAAEPRDDLRPAAGRDCLGDQTAPRRPRSALRDAGAAAVLGHVASATMTRPVLAQERHRLELDAVVVHRAARARQEERPLALRAAQHAVLERARVKLASAPGAAVAVRQERAVHVCDDEPAPADLGADQGARGETVEAVDRDPHRGGRPGRVRDRRVRPAVPARGRGLEHTLDLEAVEVGGGLLERLLDGELERHRRGGAVRAAALQADPGDPVLEREQLDVPAVRLHVRAGRARARR